MITPSFKFVQDEKFLIIKIRAPQAQIREMEVSLEEDSFLFTCPPYFLRLKTPGEIVDDERAVCRFDYPSFVFKYPKRNTGEYFEHLEFINKFLVPIVGAKTNEGVIPIEVLESTDKDLKYVEKDDLEFTPVFDINSGYGFSFRYKIDLNKINILFSDIFEVDPQDTRLFERRILRLKAEGQKFDKEHYLADFFEDGQIIEIIAHPCPYKSVSKEVSLTDAELEILVNLPNVQIPMCDKSLKVCHNGLIDILFAYCFDRRSTFFTGTCESVWNLNKLAATLCWHEGFLNTKEVLITAFRRCLIYPLYRNFKLCQTVFSDLKLLLKLDTLHILKILIEIYNIFMKDDRYVLNNMFIKPYIVYIQKWDEKAWQHVVEDVLEIEIKKCNLGLKLENLEEGITCPDIKAVIGDSDDDCD